MLGYHITEWKDGSTTCQRVNCPGYAWIAWRRDAVPPGAAELISTLEWQTLSRDTLRRWAWRRRVGRIFGTLVDRARLDSAVEQFTDDTIDVATCTVENVPALVMRDAQALVLLASVADDDDTKVHPDFAKADEAHERSPAFGPLVPLLWFDEKGFGPLDNVELLIHAWARGGPRVSLEVLGLGDIGGGTISAEEARRLASLLTAAADWCDAHESEATPPRGEQECGR